MLEILFAQAEIGINPGWGAVIAQIASTGGFCAFSWYFVAKIIPQKDANHREDINQARTAFQSEMEKEREARIAERKMFKEELEKERQMFREELASERNSFSEALHVLERKVD